MGCFAERFLGLRRRGGFPTRRRKNCGFAVAFRDFLDKLGVPFPMFGAHLSAYAQFICGILFIAGFLFRPAALVTVINFIFALLIAHRTGGYAPAAEAWIMLFTSLGFLFHGAGKLSVDEWLTGRVRPAATAIAF